MEKVATTKTKPTEVYVKQKPVPKKAVRRETVQQAPAPASFNELQTKQELVKSLDHERLNELKVILPPAPAIRPEIITLPIVKSAPRKTTPLPAVPQAAPIYEDFELPMHVPAELTSAEASEADITAVLQPELPTPLIFEELAAEMSGQTVELHDNEADALRFAAEDLPFGLTVMTDEGKSPGEYVFDISIPPLSDEFLASPETIEPDSAQAENSMPPVQEFANILGLMEEISIPPGSQVEELTLQPENTHYPETVPELPSICMEVTEKFNALDPEPAKVAKEMLVNVVMAIERVVELRMTGNDDTPMAEQELQELCIELFEYLGIEYTPESVMEFAQGIMSARQFAAHPPQPTIAEYYVDGTHEIKLDDNQSSGFLDFLAGHPVILKIGKLAIC